MIDKKIIGFAEAINANDTFKTVLKVNNHFFIADEPIAIGGTGEGPEPANYLCMALSACEAITLRMYLQRKKWDVGEVHVKVELLKETGMQEAVHIFLCEISVTGIVTDEQKQRLIHIAKACPVSKLLSKGSEIITVIK